MRLATMDVVGGVIVAAQSSKTGSSGESRGRLSGIKRSCGCRGGRDHCGKDTASSLTEQAAPVWRSLRSAGESPFEGWKSTTTTTATTTAKSNLQRWGMVVESKGGGVERVADDECNNDLCNALSCAASEGGSFGGSEHGLRNGVILGGLRESTEVKIESLSTGIMNFEPESVNSAPSVSDGGLFFWASAPCTYGSCLLKSPDPYLISTTVATDPFSGVCHGSSPEAERDRQIAFTFDDSSLSLGPRIMTTERSEGEPPPKRATRSSLQIGSLNLREQDVEASSASRLVRSTSAFGDGFSQESSGALMAPLFRSNSSMFPKPARSWADPLRFLLKKELTVTDVGELGRIILPKRDAECQLPHLDSKEGKLLTMEDYNSNKHWTLRYKWWPNNKSRMYVLESTGEFVKYYDLKEKDELIVYKDGHGKLVIRGQKWSSSAILRTDSFLGPSGFKSKSTGKRSPKGGNVRSNICKGSPTASSSNSSAQPSNNYQALDSPHEHESADVLDFKLGPATSLVTNHIMATQQASQRTTTRTPSPPYNDGGLTKLHHLDVPTSSPVANMHPKIPLNTLDCGMLPGSVHPTSASSSLHYHVEPSEIAPIGNYGAVAVHSDGAIDWEKLPDPPGNLIEFPDPPAIEFPIDEFECSWAEFS